MFRQNYYNRNISKIYTKKIMTKYSIKIFFYLRVLLGIGILLFFFAYLTVEALAAQDTTKPTITSFSLNPTSITVGNSFSISYTISDSGGSGLSWIDLWRATDNNGQPTGWTVLQPRHYLSNYGNGPASGTFFDAPPVGIYWYGIHAQDTAQNTAYEPYKLRGSVMSPPASTPVAPAPAPQTLYVSLSASQYSITAGQNAFLTADVSGTAQGTIHYQFDCTNNGSYEVDVVNNTDPYTTSSCNYPSPGTYTAKVHVERGTAWPTEATASITVNTTTIVTAEIENLKNEINMMLG